MGIRLGWLRDHGDLLRTLLRRELRAKYKGSALGVAWSYLYPLLMMAVYTVVFSVLWDSGIPHYPLVVLTGLTAWSFFQGAVYGGTHEHRLQRPDHQEGLVPARDRADRRRARRGRLLAGDARGADTRRPLVRARVALARDAARDPHRASASSALAAGLAWLFAAANVFFRDVEHFLNVLFLPWFFLTPVFYRLEGLPGAADHPTLINVMRYGNPVTPYVEGLRAALLDGVVPGAVRAGLHGGRRPGVPRGRPVGRAALRGPLRGGAVTAAAQAPGRGARPHPHPRPGPQLRARPDAAALAEGAAAAARAERPAPAVGAAPRRPRHRARRGVRRRRPERLGQVDAAQAAGPHLRALGGDGRGRRAHRLAARDRRRLPPRLHGRRERLPERRDPRHPARLRRRAPAPRSWTSPSSPTSPTCPCARTRPACSCVSASRSRCT